MKLSKIALALTMSVAAFAANAGTISIVLDDFSSALSSAANSNRTGTFLTGSGSAGTVTDAAYITSPIYSISVGALPSDGSTYVLSYDGIALPTAATAGSVSFTTLWNNYGGQIAGTPNNVSVNGGAATALSIGETVYGAYSGGAVSLAFNTPPTRSWDILIDNVTVSFNCATSESASFASLAAFAQSGPQSCANVPVPGSLALLGLGGIAAGLVSRRRAAK